MGSLPSLACFSLHPRKVITTGEGGMITVQDPDVADRLRRLRAHGMNMSDLARHTARDIVFETYPERGWNARMTDMQAALGLCQLNVLEHVLERRRALAERYTERLEAVSSLDTPYEPEYATRTWQSYCVRVNQHSPITRTELMRRLLHDGIPTRRGVMAIHHESSYESDRLDLPHTDAAASDTLMLPLFTDLTEGQQDYVIDRIALHALAQAA